MMVVGLEKSVYCHLFQYFDHNIWKRKYGWHLELNRRKIEHFRWQDQCLLVLSWTCIGIHFGWIEPASPIELTVSRKEVLHARRSCARSLKTSTKSNCAAEDSWSERGFEVCLDRGCPRLQLGPSSPAPRTRWCWKKQALYQSERLAAWLNQGSISCTSSIGRLVRHRLLLSKNSNILS